jgi:hypothetical protein
MMLIVLSARDQPEATSIPVPVETPPAVTAVPVDNTRHQKRVTHRAWKSGRVKPTIPKLAKR